MPTVRTVRAHREIQGERIFTNDLTVRNVVLTDHQEKLIEKLVGSGRYQNASEVLRSVGETPPGPPDPRNGLPIPVGAIRPGTVVVDMVYKPPITRLVEQARARGADAHGGLGMLLHQAALAFEIWTGQDPPLEAMSAAAVSELSHS